MTLGGCQWMIADNCCRKSSNRPWWQLLRRAKRSVWVKQRRTQCEHMFSALPSNSDIARCIPRGNDVDDDAIRPRSGRGALWLLLPSVRRRTCGLLPAPIRSQSAAAGSAAARRPHRRHPADTVSRVDFAYHARVGRRDLAPCPGHAAAFFMPLHRAGTHLARTDLEAAWVPALRCTGHGMRFDLDQNLRGSAARGCSPARAKRCRTARR
jgi:hypothetical protein